MRFGDPLGLAGTNNCDYQSRFVNHAHINDSAISLPTCVRVWRKEVLL